MAHRLKLRFKDPPPTKTPDVTALTPVASAAGYLDDELEKRQARGGWKTPLEKTSGRKAGMGVATTSIFRVVFGTAKGNNKADDARGQQVHSSQDDGHVPSEESPGHGSEQSPSGEAASTTSATPAREATRATSRITTMSLNRR
jgi:hypothetical protein